MKNGRIYDPLVGRFLSPDNFVQAAGLAQNFNRYSYCWNNPLAYNDPDGEWIHLLIGAVIGGTINWATHGCKFNAKGLGYFGVGALAGALGAGIGSGVTAALSGSTFGAGFIGSQSAMTAISGNFISSFWHGAAVGGAAGLGSGFVTGMGNGMLGGQNFGQALWSGAQAGFYEGVGGGLLGGMAGGIDALRHHRTFFSGATVQDEVVVNQNIPVIGQRGDNNCLPASAEAVDKSLGGSMTQEQIRDLVNPGSDPVTFPLKDIDVWSKYSNEVGHTWSGDIGKPTSWARVIGDMTKGGRVAINLNTGDVGHSVVMQSVVKRTITKISGKVIEKYLYYAMNPANGGGIMRISARSIANAKNIFFIFP